MTGRALAAIAFLLLLASLAAPAGFAPVHSGPGTGAWQAADNVQPHARPGEASFFVENLGQADSHVLYYSPSGSLALSEGAVWLCTHGNSGGGNALRVTFPGSNPVWPEGLGGSDFRLSCFAGADPAGWISGAPGHSAVAYRGLWDGIDLVYRAHGAGAKYDVIVQPWADIADIAFALDGHSGLEMGDSGELAIGLGDGFPHITDSAPIASGIDGRPMPGVGVSFAIADAGTYGFEVRGWDRSSPLVIDPAMFSVGFGGAGDDSALALAVDAKGNTYVTGMTQSLEFPTTPGAFSMGDGATDVFVTKLDRSGAQVYSALVGGEASEVGRGIAIDSQGCAYVTGETFSADFPTTFISLERSYGGVGDAFVIKLNAAGDDLDYSTYLGGAHDDLPCGIAVDAAGAAYVAGETWSHDFPATPGALSVANGGDSDVFISKFTPMGDVLAYSTLLGGSGSESVAAIALDPEGRVHLAGLTCSEDFPRTPGALNISGGGLWNAYAAKLNNLGNGLAYSALLGPGMSPEAVCVHDGCAVIAGATSGPVDQSIGFARRAAGGTDAFALEVNAAGDGISRATLLGGPGADSALAVAMGPGGSLHLAGSAGSVEFLADGGQFAGAGGGDGFVARLNETWGSVEFCTAIGGSEQDGIQAMGVAADGCIHIAGSTHSDDFSPPLKAAAEAVAGGCFAAVLDIDAPVADAGPDRSVNESFEFNFDGGRSSDNTGQLNLTWSFNDGHSEIMLYGQYPNHTFGAPGIYTVRLTATDGVGLRATDEMNVTVLVYPIPVARARVEAGAGGTAAFDAGASRDDVEVTGWLWTFSDGPNNVTASGETLEWKFSAPGEYEVRLDVYDSEGNTNSTTALLVLEDICPPVASVAPVAQAQPGAAVVLDATGSTDDAGIANYTWSFNGTAPELYGPVHSHSFPEPGNYTVWLTVADPAGNTAVNLIVVSVAEPEQPASIDPLWAIPALLAIVALILAILGRRGGGSAPTGKLPVEEEEERESREPDISEGIAKAACIFLALMLLIPALAPGQVSAAEEPPVLRCGVRAFPTTNPLTADEDSWRVLGLVYDKAIARDPVTGALVPYIAVGSANRTTDIANLSWGDCMVGDFGYTPNQTWVDRTKPEAVIFYDFTGVRWHDGYPMNVRDVMFSFHVNSAVEYSWLGNPLMDKGGRGSNYTDTQWLFVEKLWESADSTRAALKFTLQKPLYSVFEHYLSTYLLPYHVWGNMVANQFVDNATIWCDPGYDSADPRSWKGWAAVKWANSWPVGSGRFRWAGATEKSVLLEAWDGHFTGPGYKYGNPAPQPEVDAIEIQVHLSEEGGLLALEAGQLDLLAWDVSRSVAEQYVGSETVGFTPLRGTGMTYLGFNMGRTSFGYDQRFTDPEHTGDVGKPLRRATSHCVNRAAILGQTVLTTDDPELLDTFRDWENASAPAHAFDPHEAANILRKAGYVLTNISLPAGVGNWWLNPDRSFIGSEPDGTIEVLMPAGDRQMESAGTMAVNQMRAIGLNAELVLLDSAMVADLVAAGEYDMFISDMGLPPILRDRPENLYYGHFHTMGIYLGENRIGYRNGTFDAAVDGAMATSDRDLERTLFMDAFTSLAYDMPYYPLYYDTAINLHRTDSFSGFVDDGSGSLLNPLSMASARKEEKQLLRARFLGMPLTMLSNSTFEVAVRVTSNAGDAVEGAELSMDCTAGELSLAEGTTDASGLFRAVFRAPSVPDSAITSSGVPVVITLNPAEKNGYRSSEPRSSLILVFPTGTPLLLVSASLAQDVVYDRDASGAAGFTYLDITVTDPNNLPVGGADILLEFNGTAVTVPDGTERTDDEGRIRLRLDALDIDEPEEVTVNITASKAYFLDGGVSVSIVVMPYQETMVIPQPSGSDNLAIYAGIGVAVVALAVAIIARRSRKGK